MPYYFMTLILLVVSIILGVITLAVNGKGNAATGMVLLMLPAFLFAMYEKDGMPLEKVLLNIIRVKFLNPGIRPYETENLYSVLTEAEENSERK